MKRAEERVRARLGRSWRGEEALGAALATLAPPATPECASTRALEAVRAALAARPAPAPRLSGATLGATAALAVAAAVAVALLLPREEATAPTRTASAGRASDAAAGGGAAGERPAVPPRDPGQPGGAGERKEEPPGAPASASPPAAPPPGAPALAAAPPSATAAPLEAAPAASTETASLLDGVLVDDVKVPIAGALVEARSLALTGKGEGPQARTTTAEDGTFRVSLPARSAEGEPFAVLVANERRADVLALPGRKAAPRPPDFEDDGAPAEARLLAGGVIEVVARRWRAYGSYLVRGAVLDEGGVPVAHANVVLSTGPVDRFTDEQGRFELQGGPLGEVTLTVRGVPRMVEHEETFTAAEGGVIERQVRLSRGLAISGRLVSLEGAPLAGWHVRCRASEGSRQSALRWSRTDSDGRFSLEGLAAVPHDVVGAGFRRARVAAGSEDVVIRVKTDAADERDEGDHGGEIHGHVVDTGGAPVPILPGVVTWRLLAPGEDPLADAVPEMYFPSPRQVSVMGDPPPAPPREPRFHLAGLEPGRYVALGGGETYYEGAEFVAGPRGWSPAVDLAEGEIRRGVRLVVPRTGALEGEARDARTDAPLEGALVFVFGTGPESQRAARGLIADVAKAGTLVRESVYLRASSRCKTDPAGRFRIDGVPPGVPLRIVVAAAGRRCAVLGPVTLGEGAPMPPLRAALEPR